MSKIKICGLSRIQDIEAVNRALPDCFAKGTQYPRTFGTKTNTLPKQHTPALQGGVVDFIGFVFAPSRRKVDIAFAAILKEKLDPRIEAVGVFVDEKIEVITEIYKKGIIDLVQLHGDEDDEYIKRLKDICSCRVIKAIGVGDVLPSLPSESDYVLFDTLSESRGGTGKQFDWNILKEYCAAERSSASVEAHRVPFFLAGGLSAENIADAIRLLKPFCVDVSSGVETDGFKDAEKIEKIVKIVRGNNEQ